MDNGTDLSSDSNAADICRTVSQESMSSLTRTASETSSFNEGNLPKAIICIPDICRSPTKLAADEAGLQEQSSKDQGLCGKASSHSHSVRPREESVRKCSTSKQSERNSEDVIASLRSLKAASEKVREEKSRKFRQASCASAQFPSSGRRSPRQSSVLSSDAQHSASKKSLKDAMSFSDDKPKVNIFTDNLGKDLGKRIRSPRRLSEDMIALPIFSARRWSNSPKENATSCLGGRSADEISIYDGMETLSLHTPQKSFPSSPTTNKQSSMYEESNKSPLPGSSKFTLLDEIGSTSTTNITTPQKHVQSNDVSLSLETASADFAHEKCIHHELKIEPVCEDSVVQSFPLKYAKPPVLSSDQIMKASLQTDSDNIHSVSNSQSMCFPIKEDRSKHKTLEDGDHQKSSTCTDLMSTGMLIKCENRCLNDTVDSFFDVKTEVSEDMDLVYKIKKEIPEVNNFNIKINSSSSSSRVMSDTKKETNRKLCPYMQTPALQVPMDLSEEKPQSSLLCAMLVGGTEVAHSYSQERVRVKPHGSDKSDSELDMVKGDSLLPVSKSILPQLSTVSADLRHTTKSDPQTVNIDHSHNRDSQGLLVDKKSELLPCGKVKTCENTPAATSTGEHVASVKIEDENFVTDENKDVVKKQPLQFYNQLKKVNESVLKLIDIDVEEEFLQELEIDESASDDSVEEKQSDALSHSKHQQTALFGLISSLGTRLQCADSQTLYSTPVDVELVTKLVESCPKYAPNIIPRLKTSARKARLNKRLNEESVKEINQIDNRANEEELCAGGDKGDANCGVTHEDSSTTASNTHLDLEKCDSHVIIDNETCVDKQRASKESAQEVHLNAGSGSVCVPVCHLDNTSLHTAAVSPHVNESIDQNVSANKLTVPSLVDLSTKVSKNHLQKCSDILQISTDINKLLPAGINTRKFSEMPGKLSFQNSKICDDFNERLFVHSVSHAGTLRRVNSSPQINTKQALLPASFSSPFSCTAKDSHTKSKLGSKIPIPGTSYVIKSKKSWRIPRTVAEPKPLSVLSDLETSTSQAASAFTCPDLQQYLNVPSNRVIVTSDMHEEMKILDAKAKEEEERNEQMMEETDKNIDDDINLDHTNCEPDFDEVDGMLFMSFFSEIELRAHVRVEKALEWDRDDTMLRVSRAKAFEEAKAQNEDMGHFKLKHLRGQHMRWKKYRRMYSDEVRALLEAHNSQQSHDSLPITKKTSDLSKIKGWKRKNASMPETCSDVNENVNYSYDLQSQSIADYKEVKSFSSQTVFDDGTFKSMFDENIFFTSENIAVEDGDKLKVPSRSRRRQGFSHQKAHRQLFRELNMDWEDRMIHRKLGGWSLKGNRPQAFSSAAKKRQERKSKEVESCGFDFKDINIEAASFEEVELETAESKDNAEDHKKKRTIKIIYPLLTEKMARNALKTLMETGDLQRGMTRKKNKSRQSFAQLPALTPVLCKSEPEDETASTHLNDSSSLVVSVAATPLTPSVAASVISLSSPTSAGTAPLDVDLQDEPVMEGVDIAAEIISSPSVTDTSSMKSCGKPGCRYGCICHLCSANESSAPLPSPLSKQPAPACDKEYCRLGCICDSIDPERPISSKTHCRRPSCMLQCICLESGSFDGNEDIPYLPSMRRRPKPGDRFSNLPQREKTHRSAKNLDAVTRKALMLYETSEIYCERVERTRKRPETASSPASTSFDSLMVGGSVPTPCSTTTFDIDIVSDPSEDSSFQPDTFSAYIPVTSEATAFAVSHPIIISNISPQHQHLTRNTTARMSKPAFVLDDVRQTYPVMEPSAHKRQRKSHPLSDEIFVSSTCARTQPFKYLLPSKGMQATVTNKDSEDVIEISPSVSADSACSISSSSSPASSKPEDLKATDVDVESKQMLPKIASVRTLVSETNPDLQQWEHAESEAALSHCVVNTDSASQQRLKNVSSHQHPSAHSSVSNGGYQERQFHGWHKSMVCLKSRQPLVSQEQSEDDVKEEDEVKLLEFTANCNWEGAKREILTKVAPCLTRGQYPQPRTMNIREFVVEILPKAHQPSHIPAELRAKLPGQMYSVRVRITRREPLSKKEDDFDVIDLSSSSPVKSSDSDATDSSVKASNFVPADQKPGKGTSDSPFLTTSSVGISGLSKLFITSPPVSGPHLKSGHDNQNVQSSGSAPNIWRQNLESAIVISSPEYKQATDHYTLTVQPSPSLGSKPKSSSFLRFGDSASQKTIGSAFSSETIKTVTNTTVSSSLKTVTSNTTSKKLSVKPLDSSSTNQPFIPVSSGMAPIFGPFNAKDVKYMMSGKDGTMQLIEIAPTGDKKKKLIAVPITLSKASVDVKGKQNTVVALPVSGIGQSRILPVLTSPPTSSSQLKTTVAQQLVLRLPSTQASPGVSATRHPVVLQPLPNSLRCQPPRFQVVPVQVSSCLPVPLAKVLPTATAVQGCSATQKPLNSSDEMIMVFDAAHITASHVPSSSVGCDASVSTNNQEQESEIVDLCASRARSSDRLDMSADNTATKQQDDKNVTLDLSPDKVPSGEDISVDTRIKNVIDDCDNITNSAYGHLISNLDPADLGDEIESVSQGECNKALQTCDPDVFLETNIPYLSGQLPLVEHLPEVSVEAEVSVDSSAATCSHSTVETEISVGSSAATCSHSTVETEISVGSSAATCSHSTVETEISVDSSTATHSHSTVETEISVDSSAATCSHSTVETEISVDSSAATHSHSTVGGKELIDDAVANILTESSSSSLKNYSAIFSNTVLNVKEQIPKTLQECALAGSKRIISAAAALEEPLSPARKKPCLAVENPIILDEDSVASLNSVSSAQQAAASPLSSVDSRPKSVMSAAFSTGSSEDMLILLSSEEDIDVGEDDKPDDIISYRVRVERALENDHGSMYTKVDPTAGAYHNNPKKAQSPDEIMKTNVRHEDKGMLRGSSKEQHLRYTGRDLHKVNHHNQLERLRRSRMKILFDELQHHVHKERGLPTDHVMSKVKVLVEAKKVVLHLNKCVLEGGEQVKRYERKNKSLLNKLASLKANLMQQNVSAEAISCVLQRASEKFLLQRMNAVVAHPQVKRDQSPPSDVMQPVKVEVDIDESQDMVNLVSPSTDEDRVSERPDVTTPIYEDISDPEDASSHTQYE
ncbi:hypothetical protein BsWGS_17918 [Bradybaena similaris]